MLSPDVTIWCSATAAAARSGTVWRRWRRCSIIFVTKTPSPITPVKGVKRPKVDGNEGRTPALGDHQARKLLDAPDGLSLRSKRDRAILGYPALSCAPALRREELCKLTVKDFKHERRGVPHLKVSGKGGKTRYNACASLSAILAPKFQ
jgi:site-specific recombinase XerC